MNEEMKSKVEDGEDLLLDMKKKDIIRSLKGVGELRFD